MYTKKAKKKGYYVLHDLRDNKFYISTSKKYLADIIGISVDTLRRHTKDDICVGKYYVLCSNVTINTIKRGFGIKSV